MKPFSIALAICVCAAILPASLKAQEMKIGIIDMTKVFSDYTKTKDAEKRVNDEKATAKKELDTQHAKYRDLLAKWNEQQKVINDKLASEELKKQAIKIANEIQSELKSLERQMDEFKKRREGQLQDQVLRMRKGLLEDIRQRVEERAKKDNYDIVFDKSGKSPTGVNFLLFSKDGIDFTEDIIKELNKADK